MLKNTPTPLFKEPKVHCSWANFQENTIYRKWTLAQRKRWNGSAIPVQVPDKVKDRGSHTHCVEVSGIQTPLHFAL